MLSLPCDTKSTTRQLWANNERAMPGELSQWEDRRLVYLGVAVVLGCTLTGMLIGLAVWGWPN